MGSKLTSSCLHLCLFFSSLYRRGLDCVFLALSFCPNSICIHCSTWRRSRIGWEKGFLNRKGHRIALCGLTSPQPGSLVWSWGPEKGKSRCKFLPPHHSQRCSKEPPSPIKFHLKPKLLDITNHWKEKVLVYPRLLPYCIWQHPINTSPWVTSIGFTSKHLKIPLGYVLLL